MNKRSNALAERLGQGARALGEFASQLTEIEWHTRLAKDGRKIGVIGTGDAVVQRSGGGGQSRHAPSW